MPLSSRAPLLAILVLAIAPAAGASPSLGCLAAAAPNYDGAASPMLASPSPELLTGRRFALWSLVYPLMPAEGYPVEFNRDGSIESSQLGLARWRIEGQELHLRYPQGGMTRVFSYHPTCGSLVSRLESGDASAPMELAIVE